MCVSEAGAAFWRNIHEHMFVEVQYCIIRVAVLPCLLYASEIWTPLKRHENNLSVFLHRCLRRNLGVCMRARVRNYDIYAQLGNQPPIDKLLCRARLRWFGHLGRLILEVFLSACPVQGVCMVTSVQDRVVTGCGGMTLHRKTLTG